MRKHTIHRKLVNKAFTGKWVRSMEPRIRDIANGLIVADLKHVSAIDKFKGQWVPYSRATSPLKLMSSHHWTHTINFAFKGCILVPIIVYLKFKRTKKITFLIKTRLKNLQFPKV